MSDIATPEKTNYYLGTSQWQVENQNQQMNPTEQRLRYETIERKKTEEALKKSNERLDLALSVTNCGIWDWNLKTGAIFFDERFFTMAGYKVNAFPHSIEGFRKRIHPEDVHKIKSHLDKYIAGDIDRFDIEFRFANADTDWIWIRSRGKIAERDRNGKPVRFIGTHTDITEQKLAEESLRNMQKLESLSTLAGSIAHDFNNMMQSIYGYIDLAITESEKVKVKTYLTEAMSNIQRASALTRQLSTFAKGEAPVKKLAPLIPFIRKTVNLFLSGSNISCTFDIADDLLSCEYDENQMVQVIGNIIINAEQAMPKGGNLEAFAQNVQFKKNENIHLPEKSYIKISIKDHGIGIPGDILPKIFNPFFTTKTNRQGLGLSTCYSIIKRHGGTIDVESEPGIGSTFNIFLPASVEMVSEDRNKAIGKHRGKGVFVFMDNEKSIRVVAKKMLEQSGYTVVLKEEGRQVIEYLTSGHDSVVGVILDLMVPDGMGGLDTVIEIRNIRDDIPVFVTSGDNSNPIMSSPEEYGFTASIAKPFTRAKLAETLNKFMPGSNKPRG